jgi:UDP-N-acetylglucosamine 2-epimerase (non-hydrolysing)
MKNITKKNVLVVFGTRPEAIKMAPVINAMRRSEELNVLVCSTGQHKEMLSQVLSFFKIPIDFDLALMTDQQSLPNLFSLIVKNLTLILEKNNLDMVLVHGDTLTTFASAITAFYNNIPVGHVEAGLRSGDLFSPWPEEANRKLTSAISSLNFAPTETAKKALLREGYPDNTIVVTGNTVIDALKIAQATMETDISLKTKILSEFSFIPDKKMILVTGHRRESFGSGFENICAALLEFALSHPEWIIVYPVHLNPRVMGPVFEVLSNIKNIFLIKPVEYASFIYLMQKSDIILTDSGGVQEEAPSLGKPVLVMRETTERVEALNAGTISLVGTSKARILMGLNSTVNHIESGQSDGIVLKNPYGDGTAAMKIHSSINEFLNKREK